MLNKVRRGDISSYQAFRQALIDNNQNHVVDSFLPEIQNTKPEPESPDVYTPQVKKLKSNASMKKIGSKNYRNDIFVNIIIIFKQKNIL